ncbi:unnamed protein product, partial [Rotaria magnacalcarata]
MPTKNLNVLGLSLLLYINSPLPPNKWYCTSGSPLIVIPGSKWSNANISFLFG